MCWARKGFAFLGAAPPYIEPGAYSDDTAGFSQKRIDRGWDIGATMSQVVAWKLCFAKSMKETNEDEACAKFLVNHFIQHTR